MPIVDGSDKRGAGSPSAGEKSILGGNCECFKESCTPVCFSKSCGGSNRRPVNSEWFDVDQEQMQGVERPKCQRGVFIEPCTPPYVSREFDVG
jgi:hypothetical protein